MSERSERPSELMGTPSLRGGRMTTRVWDYQAEYAKERDDILDAVETVFNSGQLVLGASVAGFEREFAAYHGLPYATGVDNGTNAIKLGLEAIGVGPGRAQIIERHPLLDA